MSKDVLSLKEIWKDIPGYEGYYQVSTFGRVRSIDRVVKGRWGDTLRKGRIMKLSEDFDGYLGVGLTKNGKQTGYRVNRLVAMTFIDNPDNLPIVHHKDNDKKNNNVTNLEWTTVRQNTVEAIKCGALTFDSEHLKKAADIRGRNLSKPVMCRDSNLRWSSITECARDLGHCNDCVARHIKKSEPLGGMLLEFV